MKSQIILIVTTLALLASSGLMSIAAQDKEETPQRLAVMQGTPADTTELQNRVLLKVNEALTNGTISIARATDLKERLDAVGTAESQYQSYNQPVPVAVLQRDTKLLNSINLKLDQTPPATPAIAAHDALHSDVDELISTALADNKITSEQAESYYSRLAQIESGLEEAKGDRIRAGNVKAAALAQELHQLKVRLSH